LKEEAIYSSMEVGIMLGIQQQSIAKYYRNYGIGWKDRFNNLLFTKKDIEEIKATDGRRR
jgi:hypothetical protein